MSIAQEISNVKYFDKRNFEMDAKFNSVSRTYTFKDGSKLIFTDRGVKCLNKEGKNK